MNTFIRPYHILIIEDDPSLAMSIRDLLLNASYQVSVASTGAEAVHCLQTEHPHLIISDINLPDIQGLQLFKYLQTQLRQMPLYLFLTAKDQDVDIVLGLEYGAEDYMTKPFRSAILLARIERILKRHFPIEAPEAGFSLRFNALKASPETRRAVYEQVDLLLNRYEFDLLVFLLRHPTQICTRQQLLDGIWEPDADISPRNIDTTIMALRKKIAEAGGSSDVIKTVRGIGYRLNAA